MDEPANDEPQITPGISTTEFKALLTYFLTAIAATVFHRHLGTQITSVVDAGVPLALGLYALGRSWVKQSHMDAVANYKAAKLYEVTAERRLAAEYPPKPERKQRVASDSS